MIASGHAAQKLARTLADVDETEEAELRHGEGYPAPPAGAGAIVGKEELTTKAPKRKRSVGTTSTADASVSVCGSGTSGSSAASSAVHPPKPFGCLHPGCGKRFKYSSKLGEHTRTHTDERPFGCLHPGCGMRFKQSNQLGVHTRTHTEEAASKQASKQASKASKQAEAVAQRAGIARWQEEFKSIHQAAAQGVLPVLRRLEEIELPARGGSTALMRVLRAARLSLDTADEPAPDAEASEPSVAIELEDDEADDAAPQLVDGALEAAPEDDDAALVRETSAEARVALELLSRLRQRLGGSVQRACLVDELARVERAMNRVILVEATLALAASDGEADAAGLDAEARAGAESLRRCFEGSASTASTVPKATPAQAQAKEQAGAVPVEEAWAVAAAPTSEPGPCLAQRAGVLLRGRRHSGYPEKVLNDPRQKACADRSPGDRLFTLGSLRPHDQRSWEPTGKDAMYGQYILLPSSEPLPPQFVDCPDSHVRLEAGDDIVAACAPFANAIRAHAGRLGMRPEVSERILTLNMSACVAACCFLEMPSGEGALDRMRISRLECYGNGVDDEDAAAGPMHVNHGNQKLYTDMRLGHLYLQKYGHCGRPSWGLTIRGAGRGHLLVRAVARGGVGGEPSMTEWALTVAQALGLSPQEFHEPTRVSDVFTSRLVRLVL